VIQLSIAVFLVLFAGILSGCYYDDGEDERPDPNQYLTPIAAAQAEGITPYWLGPFVETGRGQLRVTEGLFPQGVSGVKVPGIQVTYFNGDVVLGALDVMTFRKDDWPAIESEARALDSPSAKRRTVSVAGQDAELIAIPGGTRPVNVNILIMAAGDEVVMVSTNSLGGGRNATPGGPDLNPLIDETTFVAAMQNLRPYPQ
jgi:hypothetical protein